jgi:predicted dehydrogenase
MSDLKIKSAILGLNQKTPNLLQAFQQLDFFDVTAIADKNDESLEKIAHNANAKPYDDYRTLLVENEFDCIIVNAPLHTCHETVKNALKNKINILKITPPAKNFDETVTFLDIAQKNNVAYYTASPLKFSEHICRLKKFLQQNPSQIMAIKATINTCLEKNNSWQSDPLIAGGGVLLYHAFHIIELMTDVCSMPQSLFALNTNKSDDKQQRISRTEELAMISLTFAENVFGQITASQNFGLPYENISVLTKNYTLDIKPESITANDQAQKNMLSENFVNSSIDANVKMLSHFAAHLQNVEKNQKIHNAKTLKNMAVIETAYLSAKTTMPENPHTVLKLAPAQILTEIGADI